jgi:tRNA pseudouridine32 synthase/23S rRNA pseudouridine746 synthase
MAALGIPIVGDGLYPTLTPQSDGFPEPALQLLARSLSFTDPLSGQPRHFESRRVLALAAAGADPQQPSD